MKRIFFKIDTNYMYKKTLNKGVYMKGNIIRIGSEKKGFGFILGEDQKDYFFHITSLVRCSWKDLEEGDAVVSCICS